MKKWLKQNRTTITLGLILITGLSLLLYPSFANWFNLREARRINGSYEQEVAILSDHDYSEILNNAKAYNERLTQKVDRFSPTEEEHEDYLSQLSFSKSSAIATVKIPSLNLSLPIYHGTDDSILQTSIGHLEGTSLPIGGAGTHAVISGHRGLPSAKLFTDIVNLTEGDYIIIKAMDETLTYQVDQISIVEPNDFSKIGIDPDKDYLSLMTCTPYGINTHRLFVRGERVDNLPDDYIDTRSDALLISRNLVAIVVAAIMVISLMIYISIQAIFRRRREG